MKRAKAHKPEVSLSKHGRGNFVAMFLNKIDPNKLPKTGTIADWILGAIVHAWKAKESRLFRDLANILDRCPPNEAPSPYKQPAGAALFARMQQDESFSDRQHSVPELRAIVAQHPASRKRPVSDRTLRRIAVELSLKVTAPGRPKKKLGT